MSMCIASRCVTLGLLYSFSFWNSTFKCNKSKTIILKVFFKNNWFFYLFFFYNTTCQMPKKVNVILNHKNCQFLDQLNSRQSSRSVRKEYKMIVGTIRTIKQMKIRDLRSIRAKLGPGNYPLHGFKVLSKFRKKFLI